MDGNISEKQDDSSNKETKKSKYELLKNLIIEAFENSSFKSKLIEEFYFEISTPYLKSTLKMTLVILLIHLFIVILYSTTYKSVDIKSLLGQFFSLISIMILLMFALTSDDYNNQSRLTLIGTLIVLIQDILTEYHISSSIETDYTPILQIVLLVFTYFPVHLTTALSISFLTICFLLFGSILRMTMLDESSNKKMINCTIENAKSMEPWMLSNFNYTYYVTGQFLLWVSVYLNCLYMFTCNRTWRRTSFSTLGENVRAKRKSKQAMKGQMRWIEAIMPGAVKDEYKLNAGDMKSDKWVYIQDFDNVSILFADIVGFTNMSSNKTASRVVTLLNDLFNRFDELCNITKCEKIGTLGDCYYCVGGCPTPRSDHAISCVEMGLGMCRIIQQFNKDHKESVNMRVGVHTGRVNAAIIGKQRFRFDVYSNDVIIANTMESSGQPGKVHISESVYKIIRNSYKFTPGAGLEIKKEEKHGIGGQLLTKTIIKTYFVDPKSSHLHKKDERFGKNHSDFQVMEATRSSDQTVVESLLSDDESDLVDDQKLKLEAMKKDYIDQIEEEVTFIENLRYDPDHQIDCFQNLPVDMFTLRFTDKEIEWHYQNHTVDQIQRVALFSVKLSPIVECTMCFICSTIITLAAVVFFYQELKTLSNLVIVVCIYLLSISFLIIEFWKASTYYSLLQRNLNRIFFLALSTQAYKFVVCLYITCLPNFICFSLIYECFSYNNDYYFQSRYFSLTIFAFINGTFYISALSPMKYLSLIINYLMCLFLTTVLLCKVEENEKSNIPYYTCLGTNQFNYYFYIRNHYKKYLFQLTFSLIILIILVRERERNLRLSFYVSREAEIGREEALRQMYTSQELLFNIIPKYVFEQMQGKTTLEFDYNNFNYAVSISRAGVVFASISNFFSKYYREDYKGGGKAVKLLHTIISKFDDDLKNSKFKNVEKIKTINDTYMLASGLNYLEIEKQEDKNEHLLALMDFAFQMQETLENFNNNYIIGTDKFEIKIGYNFGPVTAGIIGSNKPMYDIWGDTVNVSSRMYSTGDPGEIQVPDIVSQALGQFYVFKYRGQIEVKGKGEMNTFLCLRPLEATRNSLLNL